MDTAFQAEQKICKPFLSCSSRPIMPLQRTNSHDLGNNDPLIA